MRHNKQKITLGRVAAPRRALMRTSAENLIMHGSMRTTAAKARALRRFIEPLVTKAKHGGLSNRRAIRRDLFTDVAVKKLLVEIGPRYQTRPGGYTRITKLGTRASDAGDVVRIEFV